MILLEKILGITSILSMLIGMVPIKILPTPVFDFVIDWVFPVSTGLVISLLLVDKS